MKVISLLLSALPLATTATADEINTCVQSGFPPCSATHIPLDEKRVRREIRSLDAYEWQKVVDAMWIMKDLDTTTGQAIYGSSFRTYDSFALKHALAATDTRGDQAHKGGHFISWHLAFVLEFENALLAVDPSIGAVPYWDECITEPSVFTADYFGTDPTVAPFVVTDGKFANWPIQDDFDIADFADTIVDNSTVGYSGQPGTTLLRGPANSVTAEFVTRYGSGLDWENSTVATCTSDWWSCTGKNVTEWNDWYICLETGDPSYHAGPHLMIGGRVGSGASVDPIERGDFEDPITSPNSPFFMFHHANIDRSRMWWMNRHNEESDICNFYGFPTENADLIRPVRFVEGGANYVGAHLNDTLSSAWGFTPHDLGITIAGVDNNIFDSPYYVTHADILCSLGPDSAPYTYDTNIDCLTDTSTCNEVQLLEKNNDDICPDGTTATSVTYNFEEFQPGDSITSLGMDDVIVSATDGKQERIPMAFDTANPTGGDHDLASDVDGIVLIISEDNDPTDPDDATTGGSLNFTFNRENAYVERITTIDLEEGVRFEFFDSSGEQVQSTFRDGVENGQSDVVEVGLTVARMEIILLGSGAISAIDVIYCDSL